MQNIFRKYNRISNVFYKINHYFINKIDIKLQDIFPFRSYFNTFQAMSLWIYLFLSFKTGHFSYAGDSEDSLTLPRMHRTFTLILSPRASVGAEVLCHRKYYRYLCTFKKKKEIKI
jgi:hypothetical protein